jgi:hypothetical protein
MGGAANTWIVVKEKVGGGNRRRRELLVENPCALDGNAKKQIWGSGGLGRLEAPAECE